MNFLMSLMVSMLLGMQSQTGTAFHDLALEERLLYFLSAFNTVEIADEDVPLAGPDAALVNGGGTSGSAHTALPTHRTSNVPSTPTTPQDPANGDSSADEGEGEAVTAVSIAQKLLLQARELLASYNACTTLDEKKDLLGTSNYAVGNDALRSKLLTDMGGSWDALEEEIVDATEYQQGKTLYAQVYMSGDSDSFVPVIYATANADLSGNQWLTNLVYDEETSTWMEYVKKHPYNDSRVGYYMTNLREDGSLEALEGEFETSELWQEVTAADSADATGAPETAETDVEPAAALKSAALTGAGIDAEPMDADADKDPGTMATGDEAGEQAQPDGEGESSLESSAGDAVTPPVTVDAVPGQTVETDSENEAE